MHIEQLIELAYEPADGSGDWGTLLNELRRHLNASSAILFDHNYQRQDGLRRAQVGLNPDFDQLYEDYYANLNPWLKQEHRYLSRNVHIGDEILPHHELIKTEFYNDYLRPQDCFHRLCGVVDRDGDCLTCLSIHRPSRYPPFTRDDRVFLGHLVPHVQRALKLQRQFLQRRQESDSLLDLLHRLSVATFVIDRHGRMIECNQAGEDLLRQRDGIMLRQGCLSAASRSEDLLLRRVLADTVGMAITPARRGGGHVAISRPLSGRRLVLLICPISPSMRSADGWDGPAAIVVTKDPDHEGDGGCCTFPSLYGLTPAESRLATQIIAGAGVIEAARRIGISKNTARTHMKRIYAKTGALNQAGLVRLHAKSCTESH